MAPFSAFSSWFSPLGILATVTGLAAISLASLSPVGSAGDPGSADKTMHVVAYALTILPLLAVPSRLRFGIALGVLFWSGLIELLQPLVGRSASYLDLMANAVGILIGFSVAVLLSRVFRHALRKLWVFSGLLAAVRFTQHEALLCGTKLPFLIHGVILKTANRAG